MRLRFLISSVFLLGLAACANVQPPAPRYSEALFFASDLDSLSLDAFLALPADEQEQRRKAAKRWRQEATTLQRDEDQVFERRLGGNSDPFTPVNMDLSLMNGWYAPRHPRNDRVSHLLEALSTIAGLEPTDAGVWHRLARLTRLIGDLDASLHYLDAADAALAIVPATEEKDLRLAVALTYAWTHRDRGEWARGLAWTARARELRPRHRETLLVHGLLLAGSGDRHGALRAADRLGPLPYRRPGHSKHQSNYGSEWIKFMAFFHSGEVPLAYRQMTKYMPRHQRFVPHAFDLFNDRGLVSEVYGDVEQARHFYRLAVETCPLGDRFCLSGHSVPTFTGEAEYADLPFYLSYGEHFMAGSMLGFIQASVDNALATSRPREGDFYVDVALEKIALCLRQGLPPARLLALRGQLYCKTSQLALATVDLDSALTLFSATGREDARTLTWRGYLHLMRDELEPADTLLRRALQADRDHGQAWAFLGYTLAAAGDPEQARRALNEALDLDDELAGAWYNRGLLNCEEDRWRDGMADLERAAELAPGNAQIIEMLQKASQKLRGES